jgi:putative ABC transport system permease protein
MALVTIWANKLRALLTTLGIVIGIVSVTAMFTTINGIERAFDRSVAMLGTNVVNVQRMPDGFTVRVTGPTLTPPTAPSSMARCAR